MFSLQFVVLLCAVALADPVSGHHCTHNCDNNGLFPEKQDLYGPFSVGQCAHDGFNCDASTPGTGHRTYSSLTDELVLAERCYSFCFWNVTPSVGKDFMGGANPLFRENVFSMDVCNDGSILEAFVCYSTCLFQLKRLDVVTEALQSVSNQTCSALCSSQNGICERALPSNASASCKDTCQNEVCVKSCSRIEDQFSFTASSDSSLNTAGVSLKLTWAIPLRKQGVLDVEGTNNPSLSGLDVQEAYGLIWHLSNSAGTQVYIPQHLPFFLLQSEVGPLYRVRSSLLAVQELQCKEFNVSYALVDRNGISAFRDTDPRQQCIYGSWYPAPPSGLSVSLGYSRAISDVQLRLRIGTDSPDVADATTYGVQFIWDRQSQYDHSCSSANYNEGQILKTKNLTSTNDKELVVNGRSEVLEYVPTALNPDAVCSFFIVLYSLPQSGSDPEKRAGNLYSVYFRYPDSPHLKYNLTHNLTVDSTSGLGTVVVRLMVGESRWKALPPINTLRVALARTGGTIIGVKQHTSSLKVSAAKLVYDFVFKNIKPLPSVKEYYSVQASQTPKQGYPIVQSDGTIQHIQVRFLPRHPNEVRNLTFDHYLNIVDGQFVANASWLGPAAPQGKVREYIYILSSPSASVVIENKLLAEGRPFASNMSYEVTVQIAVEFKNHEYFNFSVRAVSEWGAYGEWTNMTVTPDFPPGPSLDNNLGLPPHVEGIIIGASILIVILIVTFIGLASTGGYYYYKKNKVVIVKNTGIWINGRHDSTGEEGEDGEDFQPVPVDSWEISPDIIIMDSMLGEGQFGEVYKGMIQDGCHHVRASNSKYVAVKILRPEASAALKSDFLKEIVTMKKITMGGCPHVVNMVGCSTLQEPIALVIEYISHGDLLTYLRTIRKLNNSSYCNFHSIESIRAKGNEYVNHGTGPSTPVTPMTPASNCPLLEKEPFSSPTSEEPTPYEKPYSSLGDLKPVDLVSFAYQIATGMEYLANLGIVHRDLACRNVLVGENKVLKISDFGMARDEDIYIKTTDGKLPLRWMAIESIVDRVFTTQSDVWSYGIVLWEITTLGGHPYPSVSNKALLAQLLRGYRMEKPENCSSDIYNVMKQCWNIRAVDRPTFIELRATFDNMLTKAQNENYIDLNVDEMLPYYSMSAVGEPGDLELTKEDLNPDVQNGKDGYPEMKGLTNADLICSVERLNDDDDDRSSIGSVEANTAVENGPDDSLQTTCKEPQGNTVISDAEDRKM